MNELNSNESKQSWLRSALIFVFEGVKDHLKGVIGAAVVGGIVVVGLYVWSGQAAWMLPLALNLLSFVIGITLTLIVIGFMGFRAVLQTREQAAAFAAGLESKEKGFFDYLVEQEALQPEFTKSLLAIGQEMTVIAEISGSIDFSELAAMGSKAVVDGLGNAARETIKHSSIMSSEQSRLESLITKMTQATGHQVQSSFINANALLPVRIALSELLTQSQVTRDAMTNWRTAQQNAYGLSQEWNTAMNHTLAVTDRILGMLENSEEQWSGQLATIDSRLLEENA